MSSVAGVGTIHADEAPRGLVLRVAALVSCAILAGTAAAYLVASGYWYVVLGLLLAVPAFVLLNRYPLAAVAIWLLVAPFVVVTDAGSVRRVFWLIHRALPIAVLAVVVLSSVAGLRTRRLPKLGWPELMMAGYVGVTMVSIAYTSQEPAATAILLYDRVVVPMCLYLLVRLLQPGETELRRLVPVVAFVLLSQSVIGILTAVAPGVLPSEWLIIGRTTGSFHDPDVFGITVLFCGMFLLHRGLIAPGGRGARVLSVLLFVLAMLMVFLTFSRGNWLAGIVVLMGTAYIYRGRARLFLAISVPVVLLLLGSGLLADQVRFAEERLRSAEATKSALSRLPVVYASIRMFEEKPLTGWGYENFERFSPPFQRPVGDLIYPDKFHASHNLYLTTLVEQGLLGIVLFLGPAVYWLFRTRSSLPNMPATDRKLLALLWLAIASHIVVNNFSVMKVPFGLGLWWLTLGLIASILYRYRAVRHEPRASTDRTPAEVHH